MPEAMEMAERHGRILAELAELSLSLARELHARALTAEAPDEAAELSAAFHRVARSARQTVALEARLERDRQRAEREAVAEAARETETRVQRRKAQVNAAVGRLIWTEAEADEAEPLEDELSDLLDEDALYDDFGTEPVEAHIDRICEALDLPHRGSDGGRGTIGRRADGGGGRPQASTLSVTPSAPGAYNAWRSSA